MQCLRIIVLAVVALLLGAGLEAQQGDSARWIKAKGTRAGAQDVILDGNDWRMRSFEFGAGVKAGAQSESFDDSGFSTVTVPGDTQLQAGFSGVERWFETKDLIAVNTKEWWYRKHFHAGPRAADAVSRIVFDGSDYFTTVWLNGHVLGRHEGTYTGFSFDVTKFLHYGGDNVLAVLVTHPWIPPNGRGLLEYLNGNFSEVIAANNAELKRPPYFFDNDWDALPAQGNAAYVMGIWRSVHVRTSSTVTIEDLNVETESIAADGSATLRVGVTLQNDSPETIARSVTLRLKPENFESEERELPALELTAAPGKTEAEAEVKVPHARLWWSWDKGPQNLYRLEAATATGKHVLGDQRSVVFGIRTITRDAQMAYWLNGRKVFIRASWFPIEDFYRSTPTRESYERDLRLFRDGNFNLLVNFTVVEKPEFYDECDRLGILVVAELPFSQLGPLQILDKDNPRREPFLKQAGEQVTQIVTTLRNHPSIVEWAPLAEAHEKAGEWGNGVDQQGYDTFMAEMKAIISELAPRSIFHPSLCDLGEQHFWFAAAGFTWSHENYQSLFDVKTGFVSEYGGVSLSSYENLGKYLTPSQLWGINSSQPRWFNLPIDTAAYAYLTSFETNGLYSTLYRTEHFVDGDVRSAAELVSDTQLYQAFVLKYATQAFRRKKYDPINGIRSWDFLELAPGFHFGIVDYDRVPKTAYWYMKRALAPVALSFAFKESQESQLAGSHWSAPVFVINDTDQEIRGTVHAQLLTVEGKTSASADLPAAIAADSKGDVGDFSLTLPQTPGVYVLRATLTGADGSQSASETSFIKVVAPAFSGSHRVLLIAQSKFASPIASMLRAMGVDVDVYDENSVDEMRTNLADGPALRSKYDVIWLGCFESLAKVLPAQTAKALVEAVKAGSGFMITGGEGGFHGGWGRAAVVEATALDAVLPVDIPGRADLVFGAHGMDDAQLAKNSIREIAVGTNEAGSGASPEALELLRHYGLVAFNRVDARSGSHTALFIAGDPLLVLGEYGAGKTAAFTGFTPVADDDSALPIDQYMIAEPQARAYFVVFADMLAAVMPSGQKRLPDLLAMHEKPLFQTLKEQPETVLTVTKTAAATTGAAGRFRARIVNSGGYAHLVHMRVEWLGSGPKPFLTEMTDNDFELMPNESREIEVNWRTSHTNQQPNGTLIVNAANAPEARLAF